MAASSFVETWQACAFQQPAYATSQSYSALLSLLLEYETPVRELHLRGNQPALSKNRLKDADTEVLMKALSAHLLVTHLDLSYNTITDEGITFLAEYLKDPSCSLRTLNLSYNDFGPEGAENLSSALQLHSTADITAQLSDLLAIEIAPPHLIVFNRSVNKLLLDGCKVGGAGGIQVASMLQVNQNITHLGLANTDLNTDCIIAMATILHGNKFLRSVDLSSPLLHSKLEETTIHLSRMLQVNATLQELHLSKHNITDTGMEWLCRHLRDNTALLHLDISCNSLSRDGARHIAVLLKTNPPLSSLNLGHNRIEDDGLIHISDALITNCTLTSLNVCHNSIGDVGLCKLAQALRRNSTLTHLTIWGNKIGEPTCNEFRDLLERSRLVQDNVDVRPYEVDGITYLARTDVVTHSHDAS